MNRLADETSPYLRQHADNPVDWYPWGEEAFTRARELDRPVLLSVGYAACHWCHVMAHESFEDPGAAAVVNELFVAIKVDREERPDVDAVYMQAIQALAGHGGWPMTVFLTPDGHPFFGGTYYPPERRAGLPSFVQVCRAVHEAWTERRQGVIDQAAELTGLLARTSAIEARGEAPDLGVVDAAVAELTQRFDPAWGGFGEAPKFPQPDLVELVLRAHVRTGDPDQLTTVATTLDAMASGGIYDHLGGGFHRYAVDAEWLVPHFEKMLYDQAGLARLYLHAHQVTGEPRWLQVASETIDYVRRDLAHPGGGFFSAEDADSEGEEGRFYLWDQDDVAGCCGDDAEEALAWWGLTPDGNFEGRTILNRPVRGDLVRPPEIERCRRVLLEARGQRVRPGLDDKVLCEWNAMFLATLAEAAAATGREDWRADAVRSGEFLLAELRDDRGRWLRSWQDGRARHPAFAADHAALLGAFLALAQATGQARWITEARAVADALLDRFGDPDRGGVFTTAHDGPALVTRAKDLVDNVIPSANGAAAVGLLRLGALTGDDHYHEAAQGILRLVAEPMRHHPTAFAHTLAAVELAAGGPVEVAVVGDRPDLVVAVQERFLPGVVLAWGEPYPSPLFEGRDEGLAYVCRGRACQAPTGEVGELTAQLTG